MGKVRWRMKINTILKKQKKFNNRKSVQIIVVVYVLIHLAFLATSMLPDNNKYKVSTLRSTQSLTAYSNFTLIRWDYAPKDNTMEVVFDLTNTLYQDGKIAMSTYAANKQIDSSIVYKDDNMIIVQIYNIPKSSSCRITVKFDVLDGEKEDDNKNGIRFYTYVGVANQVQELPILTEQEYYYNRQIYDLAYYQGLIDELENDNTEAEKRISQLTDDLERLKGNQSDLTSDELLNIDKTISNDEQTIQALKGRITENDKKITDYQNTISVLNERKAAYE